MNERSVYRPVAFLEAARGPGTGLLYYDRRRLENQPATESVLVSTARLHQAGGSVALTKRLGSVLARLVRLSSRTRHLNLGLVQLCL